jgi:hypothetical protein
MAHPLPPSELGVESVGFKLFFGDNSLNQAASVPQLKIVKQDFSLGARAETVSDVAEIVLSVLVTVTTKPHLSW